MAGTQNESASPDAAPQLDATAFVDPSAVVYGQVLLGPRSSVWPLAVVRADEDRITVGEDTNIQDGAVLHADPGFPVHLGRRVTVGHRAVVHGAHVEDECLVGIGAILLNGVRLGQGSVVAAGAVVPEGMQVPAGSVVMGLPGRVVRPVGERLRRRVQESADAYIRLARERKGQP